MRAPSDLRRVIRMRGNHGYWNSRGLAPRFSWWRGTHPSTVRLRTIYRAIFISVQAYRKCTTYAAKVCVGIAARSFAAVLDASQVDTGAPSLQPQVDESMRRRHTERVLKNCGKPSSSRRNEADTGSTQAPVGGSRRRHPPPHGARRAPLSPRSPRA